MEAKTTTKMTAKKSAAIVASLRMQLLDIHLGHLTETEWNRQVAAAKECGVDVPKEWLR